MTAQGVMGRCRLLLDNYLRRSVDYKKYYHQWYYETYVWNTTRFMGVHCYKSVSDLWNYQEILWDLKPALVIEFGTANGGSALFFSSMLRLARPDSRVVSVDIDQKRLVDAVRHDARIELIGRSSIDPAVEKRLRELRELYPGPVFAILDSDHRKEHVLAEMEMLRRILTPGDYLVVEDGNINGNPIQEGWGEGPMEAIGEYFRKYPDDYLRDVERENKFGFTFAPRGFLIRK